MILFCSAASAAAKSSKTTATLGNFGAQAADFPPGTFTDGAHYSINDFKGKVLVLYFGCPVCPTNRGSIPERNKVVEAFRDKPVKFLAITPAQSAECKEYASDTKLAMPCFADGLGVMQQRYGTKISLQNIWQVRVISPLGVVVGYDMSSASIEHALAGVKWKFKDDGYDPKLANIVDLLEWNQFVPAMTSLRPFLKQKNKIGDSARALFDKVKKTDGAAWIADADAAAADDKVKAVELYSRTAACFPEDELGKHATDSLKKLRTDKAVLNETAARQMYGQLYTVMSKATQAQKASVIGYCTNISQKYPETPTGKTAAALARELQSSAVAE
jgi:peroxiredoxin